MRRAPLLLLLALVLLAWPQRASAHATLLRATPAIGAVLDAPPPAIELEFSEALDAGFSRVQLFDSQNRLVERGPGLVDAAVPTLLRLTLPDLARGSYTALWRVRSAVDGHITEGSLPFGVGVAAPAGSLIPPAGAPDPATLPPPPLDTAARWLNLLAALLALGPIPFALLVWRPAYHRWLAAAPPPENAHAADAALARGLRRLLLAGGLLFLLTNLFFLLVQASVAAEVPLLAAIGAPVLTLLRGWVGLIWLARLALIVQLIVLALRLPPAGSGTARLWWAALVVAGVALLTLSLLSHAAADAQAALAVPLDWLHMAAMVAWLGGLAPLLLALGHARRQPEQALPPAPLVRQFTYVALAAVALLTLTGVYKYLVHIGRLDLLTATTYGRALLVKLGLFAALIVLGALNMLWLARRLNGAGGPAGRALGRNVRIELALGALVLLATGVLTSVAPSLAAWEAHEQQGIAQSATVGGVGLTLRIAPARIGDNEFAVDVADRRPGAAGARSKLLLHFGMQGMEMGDLQAEALPAGGERYTTRGSYTSMGGRWQIRVVLRRAGFDDTEHTFVVDILRGAPLMIVP